MSVPLKYREKSRFGSFYTGNSQGHAEVCLRTGRLFFTHGDAVNILDQSNGQTMHTISLEGDIVSALSLSPDGTLLVIATKLGFLRQYTSSDFELVRTWKSTHIGPVRLLAFDSTSTFIASGGSDGTVKVWDIIRKFCTHNLKDHTGLIQALEFHPTDLTLFASCDDHSVKRWDLRSSSVMKTYSSHVSTVTCIAFILQSPDSDKYYMLTGGRDSVILVWNLSSKNFDEPEKTLAAYEPIEAIKVRNDKIYSVGLRGSVRCWTVEKNEIICEKNRRTVNPAEPDLESCHNLLLNINEELISIDNNHNIHFICAKELSRRTTLNGNLEEVLDTSWVEIDGQIFVVAATNSPILQLRGMESGHSKLLEGHKAAVLSVDTYAKDKCSIVSCSRDQTIRLWTVSDGVYTCKAVGTGHTAAITDVKFLHKEMKIISCSEDNTVKCWELNEDRLICKWTQADHEKCVNSVAVSPNDKVTASASADKTICLYDIATGIKISVLEGHRKGVWTVKFSPTDQILASGSADGDIRMWSIRDGTCVKSLEGSDSSILSLVWNETGDRLISTGSDGIIRLWDLGRAETTDVLEAHGDRCWSLIKMKDSIISAGADGQVIIWEDISETVYVEQQQKMIEEAESLQKMQNMIQTKQYSKALEIALRLGRPGNAFDTLKLLSQDEIHALVNKLSNTNKFKLLEFCSYWNRNSKTAYYAQITMKSIFSCVKFEDLLADYSTRKHVELLLPFTDRYKRRIDNLRIQSRFSKFLLGTVKVTPELNEVGEIDNDESMSE